jgi:hypothetical protein
VKVPYKLVKVAWRDSRQPVAKWQWIDDYAAPQAVECLSVGWIIGESKDSIAIAPNMGDVACEHAQVSAVLQIPRSAIQRISRIRS